MPQGRVWGRGNGGQGWAGRSQTDHSRLPRESAKSLGAQRAWKEVPCDRRVIENIAEVMGMRAMKLWRPMLSQSGRRKHRSETFHRSPAPPPPTGQSSDTQPPSCFLAEKSPSTIMCAQQSGQGPDTTCLLSSVWSPVPTSELTNFSIYPRRPTSRRAHPSPNLPSSSQATLAPPHPLLLSEMLCIRKNLSICCPPWEAAWVSSHFRSWVLLD